MDSRTHEILKSIELLDAIGQSGNRTVRFAIFRRLSEMAESDPALQAAIEAAAAEYKAAEDAMIAYYTTRDRFADADAIHYGTAA